MRVTFVHISDTHIHPDADYTGSFAGYSSLEGARALVDALNSLPFQPDFVLHTGDVVYDPEPDAYGLAQEVLGGIQCPVYYLAGNHDHGAALKEALMPQVRVAGTLHYTFEHQGIQFICLDSNGDAEPPRGQMSAGQLAWLDELCSAPDERPLVVAVHHNPRPGGFPWLDDYMGIVNGDSLHTILLKARRRLRGVFHGHIHQNVDLYRDGILYSSALSSWTQFLAWPGMVETHPDPLAEPGFSVVTVTQNQALIRRWRFPLRRAAPGG